MISEAEAYKEEDEKFRARVVSRNMLESYLFSIRSALKEYAPMINETDLGHLETLVNENISWLEVNREKDAKVYEDRFQELQRLITPIMSKLHKKHLEQEGGPKIEEVN